MAKRKKRRRKKKSVSKEVSSKRDFPQLEEKRENIAPKKKKIFLYLVPLFIVLVVVAAFFILKNKNSNKVIKNSGLNLLLITLDTLRGDRVGYAGHDIETPSLDSLAQGGVSFMNAVCQVPLTLPSHASILTGTNPLYHQIRSNEDFFLEENFITLAEVLKNNGYATAAFVAALVLDSQFGLHQGFEVYDDEYKTPEALISYGPQRLAEDVYRSAASWIEKNYDRKFFIWVHYFDPHFPYTPPSPFKEKYKSRPYDGEIAYTDVYVGKLVQTLRERGIVEQTLIVVVGDHGEDLWEHAEPTHGIFLYDTALKIPLLFFCPRVIPGGIRIERQVRSVDIFPTVLDIFQIDIPSQSQGLSLVPVIEGKKIKGLEKSYAETYYPFYAHGWSAQEAVRTEKWKYVNSPRSELYDLEGDPGETRNLFEERPEIVTQLKEDLEKLKRSNSSSGTLPVKELSPEEKEKLRALGYVGGAVAPDADPRGRADPKDKVDTLKKLYAARTAVRQKEYDKVELILEEIIREDPENPRVYQSLGFIYQERNKWTEAISAYKEAIRMNPRDLVSHVRLTQCYYNAGLIEEAAIVAQATLVLRPNHLRSLMFLAAYFKSKKNIKESLVYLEEALRVEPSNTDARLEYADALVLAEDFRRAIEEYQRLLAVMPGNPLIHNKLGSVYFYVDDYEKAIEHLEKEVSLNPNANSYFLLGAAYGKLGQFPEAVNNLRKYLFHAPPQDPRRQRAEGALRYYQSQIKK